MKLIICGGREYRFTTRDRTLLNQIEGVTEVVSGGARGADSEGESWAAFHNTPLTRFPANWGRWGKRAGFRRNIQMANYADAVAVFPGGKGTAHMFRIAEQHGLTIYDFRNPDTLF